ncbi:MAG: peptidoglycan editing factor PgeF [Candidatus Marinimicrobia bacterium]|nr:peptidoglycan editing factor PgeF [Candidatus Neomarinimicrobiota bacterium]MBT4150340.1 peptidoglycan editing factor PgeF [Candidatus Neomarinimicrobiota bacterium]MBT4317505.1 peptidoglycan editing factor PgeF [Candidatus Neomarinimicrobiota bacterium]MBT5440886.1 peptidoglycan editing factor PgeF [Candidatus Neomarinimicrobiota bacterium]MBT7423670.1 peptidoglycan editing factor PgeF [Candidatus Neomarinimicrobiota bacterium]
MKNNYIDFSDYFGSNGFSAYLSYCDEDYSSLNNRNKFVDNLGFNSRNLVVPKQIHSNKIKLVDNPCRIDNVDGILSKTRSTVLSILVADCIPLFLFNPSTQYFGLIHSGWRGTHSNISQNAINKLKEEGNSSNSTIAVIGPSIGQCCFEVGPEVASKFDSSYSIKGNKDRMLLNLKGIVKDQLIHSGLQKSNILLSSECTYCETETFYSYRRQGNLAGRMVAICGWH